MIELRESYVIEGVTPQECFDYLRDLDNATEWNTFITEATSDGPLELGSDVHARIHFIISFGVDAEVTSFDEPSSFALTSAKPIRASIGGEFEEAPGGTNFTYWFRMPPNKFFPVPKMVLKRLVKVQFDKDGEQLRGCLQDLRA